MKTAKTQGSLLTLALSLAAACFPFLALTLYLFFQSNASQDRAIAIDTQLVGQTYTQRIRDFLDERVGVLRQAGAFWESLGEPTPEQFGKFVDTIRISFPEFSAINYIDQDLIIRRVHPLESNKEALDLDVSKVPDWADRAQSVLEGHKELAASVLELAQGGLGLVFVVPVHNGAGEIVGLIEGVSRIDTLFVDLFSDQQKAMWHVNLKDRLTGFELYSHHSHAREYEQEADRAKLPSYRVPIPFADRSWDFELHPSPELLAQLQTTTPARILIIGWIATTIMALGAFMLYRRDQNLRVALDRSNLLAADLESTGSRLSNLINGVDAIVYEMDRRSFGFTFVSEGVEKILGYRRERILEDRNFWISRILEEDRPKVVDATRRAIQEDAPTPLEFRMEAADGSVMWFKNSIAVIHRDGEVVGLRGVMVDTTSRRRAEASFRASERRFQEVMDNLNLAVFVLDSFGTITYCNERAQRMTGHAGPDLLGKDFIGLLPPDEQIKATRELRESVIKREVWPSDQTKIITADGRTRIVAWNGVITAEDDERVTAISLLGDDITERELEEESVRQTQKLESLGVLAGGIAHDFNNLLTAILGNTELALRTTDPGSPERDYLRKVSATSQRLAELTRQLLAYSGRSNFVISEVDLNRVIREMNELISVSVPKHVEVAFDLAEKLPPINADHVQIEQVILNLITNAAEAIDEGEKGSVMLRTSLSDFSEEELTTEFHGQSLEPGAYLVLEVEDNGCGMDPETLSRIFDPFFTTKFAGRGLGLAALRGIISGHQGGVAIQTQRGQGTLFRIIFPAGTCPAEETVEEKTNTPEWRGEGTALVIDDEEALRHIACEMLESVGFSVISAGDGQAGAEVFHQNRDKVELILLDVTMPRLSCEETIKAMMKSCAELPPIVLTSGYSRAEIERRFRDFPVVGFLPKPFSPDDLLEIARLAVTRQTTLVDTNSGPSR